MQSVVGQAWDCVFAIVTCNGPQCSSYRLKTKRSKGSNSVDLWFLAGLAYCLSAIPTWGLTLGQSYCQAVTLQRLAKGLDDTNHCEGSVGHLHCISDTYEYNQLKITTGAICHKWKGHSWVMTLQKMSEGLYDAKQCEGSETISNLTEESGVKG